MTLVFSTDLYTCQLFFFFIMYNCFLEPEICDDIKSKNVYSTLKFNDDYQLIDNGIFDFSIPKLINTNIQNYHENGNGNYICTKYYLMYVYILFNIY